MSEEYGTEQLIREFLCEAEEHFDAIGSDLAAIESALADGRSPEAGSVESVFRAVHTLKGLASMFAFTSIKELAHRLESLLDAVRKGRTALDRDTYDVVFRTSRVLERITMGVAAPEAQHDAAVADAVALIERHMAANGGAISGDAAGVTVFSEFAAECLARGVQSGLRPIALDLRWGIELRLGGLRRAEVESALGGGEIVEVRPLLDGTPELDEIDPDTADVTVEVLALTDRSNAEIGDALGVSESRIRELDVCAPGDVVGDTDVLVDGSKPLEAGRTASTRGVLRVEIQRVDELMDLAGELVTARTRLADLSSSLRARDAKDETYSALATSVKEVAALVGALQEQVMRLRMVPVGTLFSRAPRIVRDIARTLGKDVTVEIEGSDTELDKRLIEQLEDPLLHLLRNAVDHGIEPAGVRAAAGKPATGRIRLTARQEAGTVVVEITDDGGGLDSEKIAARATQLGLDLRQGDGARLAEIIMSPGFSTAAQVTDVSGRGVGLDVVRKRITDLNGVAEVESQPGHGTVFRLVMPLTLAIMPALLVRVSGETFALPLVAVLEVMRVRGDDLHMIAGTRVMDLRGTTLPVIALAEMFGGDVPADRGYVVEVTSGSRICGLLVDGLLGRQEIVVKSLDILGYTAPGIAGATILGDGSVVPIIDVDHAVGAGIAGSREECA